MRRYVWSRTHTAMPLELCKCGAKLEVASPAPANGTPADAVPVPGKTVTFCIRCARAYLVVEGLKLEEVNLAKMFKDDEVQLREMRRVQEAIIALGRIPS